MNTARYRRLAAAIIGATVAIPLAVGTSSIPPNTTPPLPPAPQNVTVSEPTGEMSPKRYSGGQSDAAGKATIQNEAKRLGMGVIWKHLPGSRAGEYSMANGKRITVDPDARRMRANDTRTLVRHETAHYLIGAHCGTTNPPIVGNRKENVTDAYGHMYFGTKQQPGYSYKPYGWNVSDANIAKKLRAGNCGTAILVLSKTPITGKAQVGQYLYAAGVTTSPGASVHYQWKKNGKNISGATKYYYLNQPGDAGQSISLTITTKRARYTSKSATTGTVKVVSAPQSSSAGVRVLGTAQANATLYAQPFSWYSGTVYTYQWKANGANIAGATGSSYKVPASLVGKTLTVAVTGKKAGYTTTTKTSAGVGVKELAQPTSATVTIAGTVQVDSTASAAHSGWASGTTFTYQWKANGANIAGATGSSYKVPASLVGKTLTVAVTGKKAGYTTTTKTSAGVAVTTAPQPAATTVHVTGTAEVGSTVSAMTSGWVAGTTFIYQWKANGANIAGATGSSLRITPDLAGKSLAVTVVGTKVGYTSLSKASGSMTIPVPVHWSGGVEPTS